MKTLVKSILASLLVSSSFLLNPVLASEKKPLNNHSVSRGIIEGKESFKIDLHQISNSEVIRAIIEKPEGKRVSVTLRDPEGLQLYNFFADKKSNRIDKDFNFSGAESGIYTLEIFDGKTKVVKQIKLERIKAEEVIKLSVE